MTLNEPTKVALWHAGFHFDLEQWAEAECLRDSFVMEQAELTEVLTPSSL